MRNFKGKNVYITGGSSGIGLAIAGLLASKGAHILIFARDEARLEQALREIRSHALSDSQRVERRRMDVSIREEVRRVMAEAVAQFGPPDVLINSAGRARPGRFEDIDFEQFEETIEINLQGVWNTVSVLAPHLRGKGGYIVNISSVAGFVGIFGYTDYCASKFAVIGFSEALRSELKPQGIAVSVLCPPDTDTPGLQQENLTKPEETRAISAKAKVMRPEQVARALVKGMAREKFIIIPGFDGKLTALVKRLCPGLIGYLMDREIEKVQSSRGKDIIQ